MTKKRTAGVTRIAGVLLTVQTVVVPFAEATMGTAPTLSHSSTAVAGVAELKAAAADYRLVDRLIAYGEQQGDPLSLALAAKIMLQSGLTQMRGFAQVSDEDTSGASVHTAGLHTVDGLLRRSASLAEQDVQMAQLIEDTKSLPRPTLSAYRISGSVAKGQEERFEVKFIGHEPAALLLNASPGLVLDVYGADGTARCSVRGGDERAACAWYQDDTEIYQVVVRGEGDLPAQTGFDLWVN